MFYKVNKGFYKNSAGFVIVDAYVSGGISGRSVSPSRNGRRWILRDPQGAIKGEFFTLKEAKEKIEKPLDAGEPKIRFCKQHFFISFEDNICSMSFMNLGMLPYTKTRIKFPYISFAKCLEDLPHELENKNMHRYVQRILQCNKITEEIISIEFIRNIDETMAEYKAIYSKSV